MGAEQLAPDSGPASRPLISFVLPIFNESGSIDAFYSTLTSTLTDAAADYDYEFLYINDGSADDSLAKLHRLAAGDDRVQVIALSRNFGHQVAVTAGLDAAAGAAAVIMDTDLQDPPAVALELIRTWRTGYEVVYAQRRSRKDSWFKKLTADLFYRLLEMVAEIRIPRNTGDFRLIDRRVIDALKLFPERNRFLRGLVSWVGYRQTSVQFDRDERFAGETGYPLRKMIKFAADGILGFSTFPLKLIQHVGWAVSAITAVGILYVLISRIVAPDSVVPGWTFTVIAILGMGGVQMIMLSVLGSYLGRVYSEAQNRPLYLVASHVGKRDPS